MSTYREPGVKVTQEFANALPSLATFALPNVIVGPAFQIVREKMAGQYTGAVASYTYPEQILGTHVDIRPPRPGDLTAFPVRISLRNTVVSFLSRVGAGVVAADDLNRLTVTDGAFADVQPGDVLIITGSLANNDGAYGIREKIDNNTVRTNESFAAAETGLSFSVRRNLQQSRGLIDISTSTPGVLVQDDLVTLPAALTVSDQKLGSNLQVMSADILLSYRALRIEKSADVSEYKKIGELQADFGLDQIVPENPLAFGAFLALNNSASATNVLALPADFLVDELLAYGKAFDTLAMTEMYAVSVLTHNSAVHTALKAHVEGFSEPDNKRERVGIINRTLVTKATVVDTVTTGSETGQGISAPDANGVSTLTSAESHFITDGVVPGMFVNVTAPAAVQGRWKVGAVDSQTVLRLTGAPNASSTGVTFSIEKDLSKNEQAKTLAAYASSLASRRLVMTWPDIVKIPVGAEIRPLPGFFLNVAIGALTTGLPTQQGLTNLSVAVYSGVVHSTKYFDRDQLNLLAGGGVMIFVQDVVDTTPLYIRHQLTTDTTAIKFQEYSVTKNVDFIAKFIRTNHLQYIGKYNITDATLDELKANATGMVNFLKENTKRPKIGGVIKGGKLESIKQDLQNIDTIVERWRLDIPIPLNNLDITIVV